MWITDFVLYCNALRLHNRIFFSVGVMDKLGVLSNCISRNRVVCVRHEPAATCLVNLVEESSRNIQEGKYSCEKYCREKVVNCRCKNCMSTDLKNTSNTTNR